MFISMIMCTSQTASRLVSIAVSYYLVSLPRAVSLLVVSIMTLASLVRVSF